MRLRRLLPCLLVLAALLLAGCDEGRETINPWGGPAHDITRTDPR